MTVRSQQGKKSVRQSQKAEYLKSTVMLKTHLSARLKSAQEVLNTILHLYRTLVMHRAPSDWWSVSSRRIFTILRRISSALSVSFTPDQVKI